MTAEIWITNILSAAFVIVGGWLAITLIFPQLETFLSSAIKDKKILHSLMALVNILILWMVAQGVILYLLKIDNIYLNYLNVLFPALDIFLQFIPYVGYLIIGTFIVIAFKKK